jgi:phosphonate transport system substrate-binding protein
MFLNLFVMLSLMASVVFAENQVADEKADPKVLVFSFQKQKNPDEIQKTATEVAEFLTKEIGIKVEVLIPTSYGVTAQGLISNKVHVAYMDSLPYILAAKEAELEISVVEKRNEKTSYDSLIVVSKTSPMKSIHDLRKKSMAFSSQTSTSGYLFPFSRLVSFREVANVDDLQKFFSKIIYAGGYDKALLAVANKQTDAAAISDYAFEGPNADIYASSEVRAKLRVLARTSGVPTHLIAVTKKLSTPLRVKIQKALISLSQKNSKLISSVYGATELVIPKGNHVENTEIALKQTGLDVKSFVK